MAVISFEGAKRNQAAAKSYIHIIKENEIRQIDFSFKVGRRRNVHNALWFSI